MRLGLPFFLAFLRGSWCVFFLSISSSSSSSEFVVRESKWDGVSIPSLRSYQGVVYSFSLLILFSCIDPSESE
jgi:hypothetical protein